MTGLQVGGISPLALINRGFQVVLDTSAQNHTHIYISGGQRGLDISLSPQDIISLTNAKIANISK
jgi:Cys-tRNA(Pro)/Cys-tRNA(Cys) deacylase